MTTMNRMVGLAVLVFGTFSWAQRLAVPAQDNGTVTDTAASRGATPGATLPRVVKFAGSLRNADGTPALGSAVITFSVYSAKDSTEPLWTETQSVTLDSAGKYNVLLGSTDRGGIPQEIFSTGDARWLGVQVAGSTEMERSVMVSVPYALKSADADSVAGHAFTDFVLTPKAMATLKNTNPQLAASASAQTSINGAVNSGTNTPNMLAKFISTDTIGDSVIYENNFQVGINTTAPIGPLTVMGGGTHKVAVFGPLGNNVLSTFVTGTNKRASMFINQAGVGVFEAYEDFVGPMNFSVNPAGGNVGINTSNPVHTLSVNGLMSSFRNGNQRVSNYVNGTSQGTVEAYQDGAGGGPLQMLINPAGGNVGMGTFTPGANLDVVGSTGAAVVRGIQNGGGAGSYSVSSPPPNAVRGDATTGSGVVAGVLGTSVSPLGVGVVGQNTASTDVSIGVKGISALSNFGTGVWGESTAASGQTAGVFGRTISPAGTGVEGVADVTSGDGVGVYGLSKSAGGTGVWGDVTSGTGNNFGVYGRIASPTGGAGVFDTQSTGNILIGRAGANPINVFRVDSTGKVFANGGSVVNGADFAESVAVREENSHYQPGDVIAIDTENTRTFTLAAKPYSTLVAGIYSTKPGVLATPHATDDVRIASAEIPLAVVGIVPCKVSNENGEIHPGDLLVASSMPGYAMKGTDHNRMTGAVIGKALQGMNGRTGVIEILVSLQ